MNLQTEISDTKTLIQNFTENFAEEETKTNQGIKEVLDSIVELKKQLAERDEKIAFLAEKVNELEQYKKKNNIII